MIGWLVRCPRSIRNFILAAAGAAVLAAAARFSVDAHSILLVAAVALTATCAAALGFLAYLLVRDRGQFWHGEPLRIFPKAPVSLPAVEPAPERLAIEAPKPSGVVIEPSDVSLRPQAS